MREERRVGVQCRRYATGFSANSGKSFIIAHRQKENCNGEVWASPLHGLSDYCGHCAGQQPEGWQTGGLQGGQSLLAAGWSDDIARLPSANSISAAKVKRPFFIFFSFK